MKNLGKQRRWANRPGAVERAKQKLAERGKKPVLAMKVAIERAWTGLEAATERSSEYSRMLDEALEQAVTGERQHRRGTAQYGGKPYRLSIGYAAKAVVLHHFYQWTTPPENWQDFIHTRRDCALAYALHEAVGDPKLFELCRPAWEIDYSEDIAG